MFKNSILHIIILSGTIALLAVVCPRMSYGQDEPPLTNPLFEKFYNKPEPPTGIRTVLTKITLGVSTGFAKTFHSHDLKGLSVLQKPNNQLFIFRSNELVTPKSPDVNKAYTNWISAATSSSGIIADFNNDYLVKSDTASIGYKASGTGIPLDFSLSYAFDRYRIGLGYSFEFHSIGEYEPTNLQGKIRAFESPVPSATFKRFYLMLGGRVYTYYDYSLIVDVKLGAMSLGGNFDNSVIDKGIFFNFGLSFERTLSEYFTVFARPSYEVKSFTTNLSEGATVNHKFPAFFLNIGAYLRLPELPRCKIKKCHIQMNHTHGGGKNWRSRMHPFWKKQNPRYGENYPKPLKELKKNKKKLNPF